jgi:ABC-type amino acid transport substrate-binding protein
LQVGAALAAPWVHAQPRETLNVIYPAPESALDSRSDDLTSLLRAALERTTPTHGPFVLRPAAEFLTQARQIAELAAGRTVRVLYLATNIEREQRLLPVRFPTRRGLLGYRLLIINRRQQREFSAVRSLADLRQVTFGLGTNWADTPVFRSQGLRVETGAYEALFKMLAMGRFQAYPRALTEVFADFQARTDEFPELAIEDTLALHYINPIYFFFNRNDTALAARVNEGLNSMLEDGSFDQHFWKFHGHAVQQARIHERRVLELANPYLPPLTPPPTASVWLDLSKPVAPPAPPGKHKRAQAPTEYAPGRAETTTAARVAANSPPPCPHALQPPAHATL